MRLSKFLCLAVVPAALLAACVIYRPDRAVQVAAGVVAHDLCSKTFVSGVDPQMVVAETFTRPGIRQLSWLLAPKFDLSEKAVTTTIAGAIISHAVFRERVGCVLLHGQHPPYRFKASIADLTAPTAEPSLPPIADTPLVEPPNDGLRAALDRAFTEPAAPPLRRTKAVVILHEGRLVAERYAPGIKVDTQLMGFSMTKSVVNAMLGILVHQGRLTTSQPAPIAEWRAPKDPRQAITVEHLMRMSSGLALDETNSGFDPSSRMVYLHDDMAKFAAGAAVVAAPGTRWHYSSPSTMLLARIVRETLDGQPEQTLEFVWRELFHPLGMRKGTLEFDGSGTFLGNMYMFASARDWARFGQLYLNDGVAGHRRLLPQGWVDFSARSSLGLYYGAGFWTLRSDHAWSKRWAQLGIPSDAFFASGDLGQKIFVLPTQRLVIVRLGDAVEPGGDMLGTARLVAEVVAATKH